jgi:hypothetical protein
MNEQEEQAQIMLDGERSRRLKVSDDWKYAKEKLDKMIIAINAIETLPKNVTPTTLAKEIGIRQKAIAIIQTWIQEVEGDGEQKVINSQINKEVTEPMVQRFEE